MRRSLPGSARSRSETIQRLPPSEPLHHPVTALHRPSRKPGATPRQPRAISVRSRVSRGGWSRPCHRPLRKPHRRRHLRRRRPRLPKRPPQMPWPFGPRTARPIRGPVPKKGKGHHPPVPAHRARPGWTSRRPRRCAHPRWIWQRHRPPTRAGPTTTSAKTGPGQRSPRRLRRQVPFPPDRRWQWPRPRQAAPRRSERRGRGGPFTRTRQRLTAPPTRRLPQGKTIPERRP